MGPRTSIEKRELVIKHFQSGKTQKQIAEMVDLSSSTVQYIIQRFVRENRVHNKGRKAPNKIFNETDERWILKKIKKEPMLSAPAVTKDVEMFLGKKCHPETVRRILRDSNFHGRTARNKPFINKKNKKARLQFAKDHLNKDNAFWNTVIFADESKFNLFASDGKAYVWRKPNTELQTKNLRATVKHGGGHVMVWGCMSSAGVGRLEFIDSTMNKEVYLDLLKQNLLQSAEDLGIRDTFRFYQDNDPKHKSGLVQTWLIWNCPHLVQTPAQSPDLNVIENVWHILEINIRKHHISSVQTLKAALKEEWGKISPDYTKKLVESMQNRMKAVIEQKGFSTKY